MAFFHRPRPLLQGSGTATTDIVARDVPAAPSLRTAAERLVANVPRATREMSIGDLRASLAGRRFACATDIAVCEEGKLLGLLTAERLWEAAPDARAGDVMDPDPPTARLGEDQEQALWKAAHHGERSIGVVDRDGYFLGVVPPDVLLEVLLAEHHEDMARLSGVSARSMRVERALQEPMLARLGHRVPWLLVGLAGALLSADLVGAFQHEIEGAVMIAFFLPAVVYLADAVGTQTETLMVRGLSIGVPMGRSVAKELLTGPLIGLGLATVAYPVVLLRWGDPRLALVLSIALFAACSVATLVAVSLPWLLQRAGTDPAFGSGPLATVIQDLLSILIYLLVARLVVGAA